MGGFSAALASVAGGGVELGALPLPALLAQASDGPSTLQSIALVIGILLLVATVFRMGMRRHGARSGQPSPRRALGPLARAEERAEARDRRAAPAAELESVLVQIQETGREIEARLDTKIRFAQRLLQEAEEALGKLELERARAVEAAERMAAGELPRGARARGAAAAPTADATAPVAPTTHRGASAGPGEIVVPAARAIAGSIAPETPSGLAGPDAPETPSEIPGTSPRPARKARTSPAASPRGIEIAAGEASADLAPPKAKPAPRTAPPEQRSQERIRALAAAGRDAKQIAREVGRPIGEVQLILALNRGEDPQST